MSTVADGKDQRRCEQAFDHALELLDVTIGDGRWKGLRKELIAMPCSAEQPMAATWPRSIAISFILPWRPEPVDERCLRQNSWMLGKVQICPNEAVQHYWSPGQIAADSDLASTLSSYFFINFATSMCFQSHATSLGIRPSSLGSRGSAPFSNNIFATV